MQTAQGKHAVSSRVNNNYLIVFCSTGTILHRKSNGRRSEVESQKLKVESPETIAELRRPRDPGTKNRNPGTRLTFCACVWDTCRTSGAWQLYTPATQRLRAGLTYAAPMALEKRHTERLSPRRTRPSCGTSAVRRAKESRETNAHCEKLGDVEKRRRRGRS